MDQNLGETGSSPRAIFSVHTFAEIDETGPDGKPPAQVTKTMSGRVEGESANVVGVDGVTDEAASSMGVETNHEEEREMMSVPENLESLGADLVVGSSVHEEHDEEHEMTGDASWLRIVDLESNLLPYLCIMCQSNSTW